MNFLESHRLLPCVVGFAISAALLWLGAESLRRGAHAHAADRASGSRPAPCSSAASASGGRATSSRRSTPAACLGIPFVAGGLAWGLAGLALITAVAATRKTLPAFAGLAVLTLLVAYAPLGVRHAGPVPRDRRVRRLGPGHRGLRPGHDCWSASASSSSRAASCAPRASAAPLLCALLLTLAASVSAEADPATAPAWAEALLLGALVGLALAMLEALAQRRHARRRADAARASAPRRRSTA